MKDIIVLDILKKCNGKLLVGNKESICDNFKTDTRHIQTGDTFVGIKGENFDGNMLYEEAFFKGASTCILQCVNITKDKLEKYSDKNIIIVQNTIDALGKLAKYKRSLFDIPVIGITGSVGKTSTKDIIASVVSKKYNTLKTEGNLNSQVGLPLTILRLKKEHEAAVIEMGMNHKGEIEYLSNIAKPTISVITNVGSSHIGNLGSRENILKAKLEILTGMNKDGIFIYNNDNDMLFNNKELFEKYKNVNFGIDNESDIMANNISILQDKSIFDAKFNNNIHTIIVPISGKHFVYNSLCATAVGLQLNISIQAISDGIKEFSLTKNRMEIKNFNNNISVINDSYNASYDSMKAALEFLGGFKDKTKIAVLGDMLELGEYSDEIHFNVGKCVYENNIDILITVGDNSKKIAEGAKKRGMLKENIKCVDSKKEALDILKKSIFSNLTILLKASNSMNFIDLYNNLLEILK